MTHPQIINIWLQIVDAYTNPFQKLKTEIIVLKVNSPLCVFLYTLISFYKQANNDEIVKKVLSGNSAVSKDGGDRDDRKDKGSAGRRKEPEVFIYFIFIY